MLSAMSHAAPSVRNVPVTTHGRYLVRPPASHVQTSRATGAAAEPVPLLVAFHGYSQRAEHMLEELEQLPSLADWLIVAVQGLHRFYDTRHKAIVASWMTSEDRELAIADNMAYTSAVVDAIKQEWSVSHLVYAGFSQGVAMAYRAAALGPHAADGLVALAGDLPPEIREETSTRLPSLLLGRGRADEWYTEEKLTADRARLDAYGVQHQIVVFEGGHKWTPTFREAVDGFVRQIAAREIASRA